METNNKELLNEIRINNMIKIITADKNTRAYFGLTDAELSLLAKTVKKHILDEAETISKEEKQKIKTKTKKELY